MPRQLLTEPPIGYDAARSSLTEGTMWLHLETNELVVQLVNVGRLYGPPRGPWFRALASDKERNMYELEVTLPEPRPGDTRGRMLVFALDKQPALT